MRWSGTTIRPEQKEQIRDMWKKHGFRPLDLFGSKWADDQGCSVPNEAYVWAFVEALLATRPLRCCIGAGVSEDGFCENCGASRLF